MLAPPLTRLVRSTCLHRRSAVSHLNVTVAFTVNSGKIRQAEQERRFNKEYEQFKKAVRAYDSAKQGMLLLRCAVGGDVDGIC